MCIRDRELGLFALTLSLEGSDVLGVEKVLTPCLLYTSERDQHQQQQGVLPQAHAVQHGMTLFSHEIGLCQAMARGDTGVAPCKKMKQDSLAVH